ncbi:MAG: hypothetical protein ACREKI_06660 [Gemmatimonadota bacterium]
MTARAQYAAVPLESRATEAAPPASVPDVIDGVRGWAGLAKWVSLAGTIGIAGLGFSAHESAEDRFAALEALCASDVDRCRVTDEGTYVDAEAEALFQDVLDKDREARIYLVGSQIGLVATVTLFILDLKNGGGPENIPYEPETIRLHVTPDEVRLAWYR